MIEVLVVVAILALLMMLAMNNLPLFIARGQDSKRKSNLSELRIAMEQYYADKHCYPPAGSIDQCESTTSVLAPYIKKIPCDPVTKEPYMYVPNGCSEFRLYTTLVDLHDKDISAFGCSDGCGFDADRDGEGDNNYGTGSSNVDVGRSYTLPTCMGGCLTPGDGACCFEGYKCDSNRQYCLK